MPAPVHPRRRYRLRRIVFGLLAALLLLALSLAGEIAFLSARAARDALTPPRLPITTLPASFGISAYTEISLVTADSIQLKGWYVAPQPKNGMVILLLHGYAANRSMLLPEAGFLVQAGYGVLLFDFRGHGESGPAQVTFGDTEKQDLAAALDWVTRQPGVLQVGAIGFSMGGVVLAETAAADSRLSAVVVEAAFPSLESEISYRARVFGWFSQLPAAWATRVAGLDASRVRPIEQLCAISPRRLLLIYGENDSDVPPRTAQAMQAAACPPAEMWIIPGAGHQNYTEVIPAEYARRLVSWFGR